MGLSFVVKGHPRGKGIWTQYYSLNTRLRGRVYYSDIISPDQKWERFDGSAAKVHNTAEDQAPENYHDTHNHYQAALYEVINLTPNTNAVPVWGDGAALAHGSSAWGAFFSARSAYVDPDKNQNVHFGDVAIEYSRANPPEESFDCQLTGLEVDVLNGALPGVFPNKAKHGITIVGFGNPNSHAISVICENFDCPPEMRKGQFEAGLYFQNSLHPDYGRLVVSDMDTTYMGIDLRRTIFKWGAVQIRSSGSGTGIVFGEGRGGEIYTGNRWSEPDPGSEPSETEWMTIRMAERGIRIATSDGTREMLAIDCYGGVYIDGELLDHLIQRKVEEVLKRDEIN